MKIELKKLKVFEEMSEETTAFVADLWINGKKVAYAKNDGHGGCTFYNAYPEQRELLAEAEAYCQSLPPHVTEFMGKEMSIDQNLEFVIDCLVSEKENEKFIKARDKACIKNFVYGTKNQYNMRGWKKIKNLNEIPYAHLQRVYDSVVRDIKGTDKVIFNTEEQLKGLGIVLR
jgi:hypothetical protein